MRCGELRDYEAALGVRSPGVTSSVGHPATFMA
jgi:hypothetical protein